MLRKEFNNIIREDLGPDISSDNIPGVNLEDTSLYDKYDDDTMDAEGGLADNTGYYEDPIMATGLDQEVPSPEMNDNNVNTSAMFPIGNIYAIGKVIRRKRCAYGNAVVKTNYNPRLDMRKYRVVFDDEEVSELTENVISSSMYDACDDSVNEYLVMDSIVDYQNSDKATSVYNHKVVHIGRIFMRRSTVGWQLCVQ